LGFVLYENKNKKNVRNTDKDTERNEKVKSIRRINKDKLTTRRSSIITME